MFEPRAGLNSAHGWLFAPGARYRRRLTARIVGPFPAIGDEIARSLFNKE